jgi:hypothetical protein
MKIFYCVLAVSGFGTGCAAAWYWYQASKVSIVPTRPDIEASGSRPLDSRVIDELQKVQPVPEQALIDGAVEAATEASRLNKTAAIWTAVSVFLNAFASLLNGCLQG